MLDTMGHEFVPGFSLPTINETTGERRVFYRLSESDMFNYANKMSTVNGEKLIDVIPRMLVSNEGFVQVSYADLDKSVRYELFEGNHYRLSCKRQMREMLERGDVVMVYSEQWKIPTSLPYVIQNAQTARVFVNISDFVNIDQYGVFKVLQVRNYSGLMAILFAACVSYVIANTKMVLSADVGDALVMMYSSMMTRTINSLIHMDPITQDKIRYLSTEFALIQMYGTDTGWKIFNRYRTKYFPRLGPIVMDAIDDQFNLDCFDSLEQFIEEIRRVYPSMRNLSMTNVFDKWIRQYGAATALSIDYIGYHLYTMCMVLFESPLIVRPALEPALDKSRGADAYKRLQALIESHR